MIRIGDFKITQKQRDVINEILDNGRITEGPFVKLLEREMEKYLGVKHAIAVTNGTVALQLIAHYLTHRDKKYHRTLVPAMTFPATYNAFYLNGNPVTLCDIGEDLQINIESAPKYVLEKTEIIVPVHLMGYPCNMDKIMEYAKEMNAIVVEDACEAFGAEYNGKKVGTIGHFGAFSFYVSHNLSSGELGLVVTNDDEAAEVMRSMKAHGRLGDMMKFNHQYHGSNYKTTEFTAGLCWAQMEDVNKLLNIRLNNARYYFDNITNDKLEPYHCPDGFSPLGYPIDAKTEEYRNKVCKALNDNGIETRNIFPNLANQPFLEGLFRAENYPVANEFEKRVFYIGVHQHLTEGEKQKIVSVLNSL